MSLLIVKLILMPLVIAYVTLISRKWGHDIAGIFASLPFVAGPILLFMALEEGIPFAVATIPGVMVGILGWVIFCSIYIWVGQHYNALISTLAGYIAYVLWGALIQRFIPLFNLHIWLGISILGLFLGLKYFPKIKSEENQEHRNLHYEIPLRMIMITLFVIGITYFAKALGTSWSGILTPFPVITTVLAIFTHYTHGIHHVRKVFMGLFTGMFGFAVFLYLQAFLLIKTSIFFAFLIGFVVDFMITLGVRWLLKRALFKI